jgi:hypothetical protein
VLSSIPARAAACFWESGQFKGIFNGPGFVIKYLSHNWHWRGGDSNAI